MSVPTDRSRAPRMSLRVRALWLVAGAFVLGLISGGLVVGGLREAPDPVSATSQAAPPLPLSDAAPNGDAGGPLTDACLRAVWTAEQAYDVLDDVGRALADLDGRRLDDLVHQLRPLHDQLRVDTAACDIDARRPAAALDTDDSAVDPVPAGR